MQYALLKKGKEEVVGDGGGGWTVVMEWRVVINILQKTNKFSVLFFIVSSH